MLAITRRIARGVLATAMISASALAVTATNASAAAVEIDYGNFAEVQDTYLLDAKVGNTYSMGGFNDNGDVFYTADWEHDSRRVAVYWKLKDNSRQGLCISTVGPVWVPTQGWVGRRVACNKDLPEGKTVLIRSGTCDGTVHSCTRPDQYGQWTAWDSATV